MQLALRAGLVAGIVLPRPPRLRHRLVAPADAGSHFRDQATLERPVGGEHGAGIEPLCLEMLADRLLERLGVLQHLFQLLGLQPRIVVRMDDAVMLRRHGHALRHRRPRRLLRHPLLRDQTGCERQRGNVGWVERSDDPTPAAMSTCVGSALRLTQPSSYLHDITLSSTARTQRQMPSAKATTGGSSRLQLSRRWEHRGW